MWHNELDKINILIPSQVNYLIIDYVGCPLPKIEVQKINRALRNKESEYYCFRDTVTDMPDTMLLKDFLEAILVFSSTKSEKTMNVVLTKVYEALQKLHVGDVMGLNKGMSFILLQCGTSLVVKKLYKNYYLPEEAFYILQEKQGGYFYGTACGFLHKGERYDMDDTEQRNLKEIRADDDVPIIDGVAYQE